MKPVRLIAQILVPALILGGAALGARYLVRSAPPIEPRKRIEYIPAVKTHAVKLEPVTLQVEAHGFIQPRREIEVIPQVGGEVVEIHPALRPGGFFKAGEVLARIEARDYRLARTQAAAQVAQAQAALQRERALGAVAAREWQEFGKGKPDPLVLRKPQLAEAEARLAAARAGLEKAELDLERTAIRARFNGRVRTSTTDLGQVVAPGHPLARVFATDYTEVRLSVPVDQVPFLDLPLGGDEVARPSRLELETRLGDRRYAWPARIHRTEAGIDPRSRVIHLVARIRNPYAVDGTNRPPLMVGMYVRTVIPGIRVKDVATLPRRALADDGSLWLVDAEDRLHRRTVTILRKDATQVFIRRGLAPGDRVCLTRLNPAIEGMRVKVTGEGVSR